MQKNIVANIFGVGWNGLLVVLVTPVYVSLLGMEGFGLIGFWLLMQYLLALFDFGLGAAMIREFATSDGQIGVQKRRDLLRTMELIYWPVAAVVAGLVYFSSGFMAEKWLNLSVIPVSDAACSIQWMALALGLLFPNALYSSGLAGLQSQGRMNLIAMAGSTLRHGGGVLVLFWKGDLVWYFAVQAGAAAFQTLLARYVLLHRLNGGLKAVLVSPRFRPVLLRKVWRFSAGMALTMMAGVIMGNMDRLFLSKMLPAAELGKYTVAWTLTGLLQLGIQPFYRAYFPRFAELSVANMADKLRDEYFQGCRLTAWVIIPFTVMGLVFTPQIFRVWMNDADATIVVVFRWLVLGVSSAGLMWLPAAFQQAGGWTRLHALMIIGALTMGIPLMAWSIQAWGTPGAAVVWVLHGLSGVTLGLWLMHRRLLIGLLGAWYRYVVFIPLGCSVPIALTSRLLMPVGLSRWMLLIWMGLTCVLIIVCFWLSFRGEKWTLRRYLR